MEENIKNEERNYRNRSGVDYDSIDPEELKKIKTEVLKKGFSKITRRDLIFSLIKLGSLSFVLVLFSVFFINIKWEDQPTLSVIISALPLFIFCWFIFLFFRANSMLKSELYKLDSSEAEVTRIVDKYSGIIDGIGTALPLFGAALILYIIAQIDPKFDSSTGLTEPHKIQFTQIALPFEIKSLLLLAAAKLFESVFDQLALRYQEVIEHVKDVEKVYYFNEQTRVIKESFKNISLNISSSNKAEELQTMKDILTEFNKVNIPDENTLKEIQYTSKTLAETVSVMSDSNVVKSLDNLVMLAGKNKI